MFHLLRRPRSFALAAAALGVLGMAAPVGTLAAQAAGIGSPAEECADFGFPDGGVKYDDQPPIGTSVSFAEGGQSFTIQAGDTKGIVAGWTSTVALAGIIVKGSNGANAYTVSGTSETGVVYRTPRNSSGGLADISHVTLCFGSSSPPPPPPPVSLELAVDASGAYTKTFLWSIDKSVDRTWIARAGDTAPLHYDVAVANVGYELSDIVLGGTVTVTNPNAITRPLDALTVSPTIGGCTLDAPTSVAPGATDVAFACTVTATDEAAVVGLDIVAASVSAATPATASPAWQVTTVNEDVTVTDSFDGGPATALTSSSYGRLVATPAALGCRTVANTAVIVETGQSDTTASTVCRQYVTAGGFTIGFWGNKNGQARIGQHAASLCTTLAAYGNVLALPTTCDATTLPAWVKTVLGGATSKDTGASMFRAQFLATALNVATDAVHHLGETDVVVNPALVGAPCLTVAQLLDEGNARFPANASVKAWVTGVKDIYDAINNNRMAVCP
jgi:hypothetical protein